MSNWTIPKMWEGGECWIIGGGPSMPREFGVPEDVIEGVRNEKLPFSTYSPYLSPIHDRHVIGINAAFMIGTWMDMVLFGDRGFYLQNQTELLAFPKLRVGCSQNLKDDYFKNIKYIHRNRNHPVGISQTPNTVSWNKNTGAAGISLAYHLGVKRIYLLGFDMKLGENGAQHWHRHYGRNKGNVKKNPKKLPFARHLLGFSAIKRDADRLGLEIINVSPDSAIKEFKRVTLSDVL